MSREAYFILLDQVKFTKEGEEIDSDQLFRELNPHLNRSPAEEYIQDSEADE